MRQPLMHRCVRELVSAKWASARVSKRDIQAVADAPRQRQQISKVASSQAATQGRFRWSKRFVLVSSAAAGVSLAVASGGDPAHARALAAAVPRTGNALLWCGRTFFEYTRLKSAHPQQSGREYDEALHATHTLCADRLLQLCQV